jgi:hypothetical protein
MKGSRVNDQNDKKFADQRAEEVYEAPKVIRVSLRPDEAVLGHCKVTVSPGQYPRPAARFIAIP